MEELGEKFKQRRQELEIDLSEAQEKTNIKLSYLKAIENGDFDKIEAEVYLKGFLKVYSNYLDLNTEKIMEEYRQLKGEEEGEEEELEEEPGLKEQTQDFMDENQNLLLGLFLGFLLLLVVVTGLFLGRIIYSQFAGTDLGTRVGEYIPATVNIFQNGEEGEEEEVVDDESVETEEEQLLAEGEEDEEMPAEIEEEVTEESEPTEEVPSETEEEESREDYTEEEITIEVETIEETWYLVEIEDENVFQELVPAGETHRFSGREIRVRIGNAAGVQIIHGGERMGPFGEPGEIVTQTFGGEEEE